MIPLNCTIAQASGNSAACRALLEHVVDRHMLRQSTRVLV